MVRLRSAAATRNACVPVGVCVFFVGGVVSACVSGASEGTAGTTRASLADAVRGGRVIGPSINPPHSTKKRASDGEQHQDAEDDDPEARLLGLQHPERAGQRGAGRRRRHLGLLLYYSAPRCCCWLVGSGLGARVVRNWGVPSTGRVDGGTSKRAYRRKGWWLPRSWLGQGRPALFGSTPTSDDLARSICVLRCCACWQPRRATVAELAGLGHDGAGGLECEGHL